MFKTLAFIENDMYIRNFITSGAFDGLMKHDGFRICISEIVEKLRDKIPKDKIIAHYQRHPANRQVVYQFNRVSMMANRHKSRTFDIKVNVNAFGEYGMEDLLLANQKDFSLTHQYFLQKMQPNPSIEPIVAKLRPDLAIFPVTGIESTGTELILLSKKYDFKTFLIVNGWDNLSSKGLFPILPDYLGVWGPQSLLDAVEIHNMPHHRCLLLGCSRYEDYFKPELVEQSPFEFNYILFAGATTACDEITPLQLMEESIEESGLTDVKVIYRPHPWREKRLCFDDFVSSDYKHVVMDPQVEQNYFGEKTKGSEGVSSQNFPELSYYPSLVNHALFVTSPMSSMTLEAGIFDVPAMVLAYNDGVHKIPTSAQMEYRHFEGGQEMPGWFFAKELREIKPMFSALLKQFANEKPGARCFRGAISKAVRKYLHHDERTYAQRLDDAVAMIEAEAKTKMIMEQEGIS